MESLKKRLSDYKILFVLNEEEVIEEVSLALSGILSALFIARTGKEGRRIYLKHSPDIVVADLQIDQASDLLRLIRKEDERIPLLGLIPLQASALTLNENLIDIVYQKEAQLTSLYAFENIEDVLDYAKLLEEIKSKKYHYIVVFDIADFIGMSRKYGKEMAYAILDAAQKRFVGFESGIYKLFKAQVDRYAFLARERSHKKIRHFAESIKKSFEEKFLSVNGIDIKLKLSCGIAGTKEGTNPLIDAEYALENAKMTGECYFYHDKENIQNTQTIVEKIKWLKIAQELVKKGWIEPFYQPIKEIKTQKIVKYEVLARGMYKKEILSPQYFIEDARFTGVITSITKTIIEKSFGYFEGKNVEFSINLTQTDLFDTTFWPFLVKTAKKYRQNPNRITFEIYENIDSQAQYERYIEALRRLKKMGFKIARDNFGLNATTDLSEFMEIEFDYLKIDASLIKNIDTNEKERRFVTSLVKMAHSFGMKTIAEHVENASIEKTVAACGVDYVQGYSIGKPTAHIVS